MLSFNFGSLPDFNRQRASNVDPYLRETRLQAFIDPVRQAWQNEDFKRMSSSFAGFCNLLGLGGVGPYMQAKQAQKIEDWSIVTLDNEGKQIQEDMTAKFQVQTLMLAGTTVICLTSIIGTTFAWNKNNACSFY